MALGFFLAVLSEESREPSALICLTYVAGVVLAVGLLVLPVGLSEYSRRFLWVKCRA